MRPLMRPLKPLTIRNAPPRVAAAIRQRARAQRVSLNRAVIGLIEEHLAESDAPTAACFHDLDELAGTWSAEEAREFDRFLGRQRKVDRELWE